MKHPFYIGQSHDDVMTVCKRTGRQRKSLRVMDKDGNLMESERVNLADNLIFVSEYPDVTLTFKRSRLPDAKSGLCYRVAEIRERADERVKTAL